MSSKKKFFLFFFRQENFCNPLWVDLKTAGMWLYYNKDIDF